MTGNNPPPPVTSSHLDDHDAHVATMVARLARIDATFADWVPRQDARIILMREDDRAYIEAARRYDHDD